MQTSPSSPFAAPSSGRAPTEAAASLPRAGLGAVTLSMLALVLSCILGVSLRERVPGGLSPSNGCRAGPLAASPLHGLWCSLLQSDPRRAARTEEEDGQQKFIAHVPVPSQQGRMLGPPSEFLGLSVPAEQL